MYKIKVSQNSSFVNGQMRFIVKFKVVKHPNGFPKNILYDCNDDKYSKKLIKKYYDITVKELNTNIYKITDETLSRIHYLKDVKRTFSNSSKTIELT